MKLKSWFNFGLLFHLSIFLPFLPTEVAHSQVSSCDSSSINENIQRLDQLDSGELDAIVQCGDAAIQPLIAALQNDQIEIASQAAIVLYDMGAIAQAAVPTLVEILSDTKQNSDLRRFAAYALEAIKPGDRQTIEALLTTFKREQNLDLRSTAALALAANIQGARDIDVIQTLIDAVSQSDNESIRSISANALGDIATANQDLVRPLIAQPLIQILQDPNQSDRMIVACLYPIDELVLTDETSIFTLINLLDRQEPLIHQKTARVLENISNQLYNDTNRLSQIDARINTLQQIQAALIPLDGSSSPDIEQAQVTVISRIQGLKDKRKAFLVQAAQQYAVGNRAFWIIHPLFWLALIFAYPKSPQIQAIFFWNKYVRSIFGFWYVGFLLAWIPPLRCRLFAPFKDSLLADAKLDIFDPQSYFPDSEVQLKGTHQTQPLAKVLPEIKGEIILEGESGLGKTMLLRHLARQTKRVTVYLPAYKCEKGVIEAIQAKLHGQAQDAEFLRHLIYSGALDICIDGLNEVGADVRANITAFVESYFKGNILITTQPLLWNPPSTAKTYVLQPLPRNQIQRFLSLQQQSFSTSNLQVPEYEKTCAAFLETALNEQQPAEDLALAQRILSNPMDLSVAAQIIRSGLHPDLFQLQQQQYMLMAKDYEQSWNQKFPLNSFSDYVYEMRLNDQQSMTGDDFYQALSIMEQEQHRMVLSRQWQDQVGSSHKEWSFRHDKIMEFFLVQPFLDPGEKGLEKRKKHLGDSRFRGIYLMLARLLPLDAALALREDLIQHAADTKDHTASDDYVQIMRSRTIEPSLLDLA